MTVLAGLPRSVWDGIGFSQQREKESGRGEAGSELLWENGGDPGWVPTTRCFAQIVECQEGS